MRTQPARFIPWIACIIGLFCANKAFAQLPTYYVTTVNDSGPGSLRQAILDANGMVDQPASISFNIPGPGPHKIIPVSPLPAFASPIFLDGLTQSGASANTSLETNNAVLMIELSGERGLGVGITMSGPSSTVRGIVFNRFTDVCVLVNANFGGNTINGCWFGPDANGNHPGPTYSGIRFQNTGMDAAGGKLEYENWFQSLQENAIEIENSQYVSLGRNRMESMVSAVVVRGSSVIGLGDSLIVGTAGPAVDIDGSNDIDINRCSVTYPLSPCVTIRNSSSVTVSECVLPELGIEVFTGTNNRFSRNTIINFPSIPGINLHGGTEDANGRTANDPMDADDGPNHLQNYPAIQTVQVTDAGTYVQGTLNSTPDTDFEIEFYSNEAGQSSAGRYFGGTTTHTDSQGNASFSPLIAKVLNDATEVAAIAIDPDGNTSEFSDLVAADVAVTNYHDIQLSGRFTKDVVLTNELTHLEFVVTASAKGSATLNTNLTSDLQIRLPAEATLVTPPAGAIVNAQSITMPGFTLRPGESNVFNADITFKSPATFGEHDVTAEAHDSGPITANNRIVVPAYVVGEDELPPALGLSLLQTTNVAEATWSGWQHAYQIIVTNSNLFPLRNVVLTNYLPATNLFGARLISASGTPLQTDNTLIYSLAEIPSHGSATLDIVVGPTAPTTLTNSVRFGLENQDCRCFVLAPETAETNFVSVTTQARTSISISNVGLSITTTNTYGFPGGQATFQIELSNRGYRDEEIIMLTNYFSSNLELVSATAPGNQGMINQYATNREVLWQPFNLSTGQTLTATIVARVTDVGTARLSGSFISGTGLEVTPEDNFAFAEVISLPIPIVEGPDFNLNFSTGLFEETVAFQNQTSQTLPGVRILISDLPNDVEVYNATGKVGATPYVDYRSSIAPTETIRFHVEFYRASRTPFDPPTYIAILPPSEPPAIYSGESFAIDRQTVIEPGYFLIEFAATPGARYLIQYSSDMVQWNNAQPLVTAPADRVQWLDSGPPKTDPLPDNSSSRFYRVIRVSQ